MTDHVRRGSELYSMILVLGAMILVWGSLVFVIAAIIVKGL